MRLPDFICIGAMRCGTTTLWNLMAGMPDVFMPERKELHFFDKDYELGLGYYSEFFSPAQQHQICGEFTPDYLPIPQCAARVRANNLNPRILVILRDPVVRAWSHYRFSVRWGPERLPFGKALDLEEQRINRGGYHEEVFYSYFQRGCYAQQLQQWSEHFTPQNVLVVFLEELRQNPKETLEQVRVHIGLTREMEHHPEIVRENEAGKFPKHLSLHKYLQAILDRNSVNSIAERGLNKLARLAHNWNLSDQIPRLSERDADQLRERYVSHDRLLEDWLGRSLPWSK